MTHTSKQRRSLLERIIASFLQEGISSLALYKFNVESSYLLVLSHLAEAVAETHTVGSSSNLCNTMICFNTVRSQSGIRQYYSFCMLNIFYCTMFWVVLKSLLIFQKKTDCLRCICRLWCIMRKLVQPHISPLHKVLGALEGTKTI